MLVTAMNSQEKIKLLQEIALESKNELSSALIFATETLRDSANVDDLEKDYTSNDKQAMYNEYDFKSYDNKIYTLLFFYLLLTSLRVTNKEKAKYNFNPSKYILEENIKNYSKNIATQITNESKKALFNAIDKIAAAQDTPSNSIKTLNNCVGLNNPQVTALNNYKNRMYKNGLKPNRINDYIDKYSKKKLMERTDNIADEELSKSARMAQVDAIRQATNQGIIDKSKYHFKWILNRDERLCTNCASMFGATREINEPWSTPVGLVDIPNLHNRCRCDEELVEKK